MLMWRARTGRIDAVIGGPPGRHPGGLGGSDKQPRDPRTLALVMWLRAVSQAGRWENGTVDECLRPVGLVVEHPEPQPYLLKEFVMDQRPLDNLCRDLWSPVNLL